ncbi:MAG: amidohydrolase family protein [Myxococcales bacterium]|nr:amidohydrolase family protein [Myxococcales bacterium]
MPSVIDIDSHFEPGEDWLDPYPELKARLPAANLTELAVDSIVGDLLRGVPPAQRPPFEELEPPGAAILFGEEKADEALRRAEFEGKEQRQVADAGARVKWLDAQGIALQNVICLGGMSRALFLDDPLLARETMAVCNSWLADTCDEAKGRLLPVSALTYDDLDWSIAELSRMRARGSRIFLIPAAPIGGKALCHPDLDRLWSAAVDLAMVPMIHVGFGPASFDPGWANIGGDTTTLRLIGSSHRHQAPQVALSAMIYGGVFERHPKLTVTLAEVGIGWLPWFYRDCDDRVTATSELFLGKWELPLKPSEYLARNVKGTPLGWGSDQPLPQIMRDLPEDMVVFSSDFPHFEGYVDPMGHYGKELADFSEARLDRFYGGAMADVFAQMGDPIL